MRVRGFRLSAPQAGHDKSQSPPLMETEPENTEQPTCDRCRLRNYRASQLEVVELGVFSGTVSSRSPREEDSKREEVLVVGKGGDSLTYELWTGGRSNNCVRAESGESSPSVSAVLNRHGSKTTANAADREAQGHVLIETVR